MIPKGDMREALAAAVMVAVLAWTGSVAADKPGKPLDLEEPKPGSTDRGGATAESKADKEAVEDPPVDREQDAESFSSEFKDKVSNVKTLAQNLWAYCAARPDNAAIKAYVTAALNGDAQGLTVNEGIAAIQSITTQCTEYCQVADATAATKVDFCGLRDPISATAAMISDPRTAVAIRDELLTKLVIPVAAKDMRVAKGVEPLAALSRTVATQQGFRGKENALATVVSGSTQAIELALAGLARLIEDRARREGVGWFLERMSSDICWQKTSSEAKTHDDIARLELTEHWFPALCGLASAGQMLEYGAGATMLRSLRAAIESDLKGWPGAAAGLGMAALFRLDADPTPDGVFVCATRQSSKPCAALAGVRAGVKQLVGSLLAGSEMVDALQQFGEELHTTNIESKAQNGATLGYSPAMDLLACAVTVPVVLRDYRKSAELAIGSQASSALMLAGLTHSAACANLTVKGKTAPYSGAEVIAGQTNETVERISTILRLRKTLKVAHSRISTAARQLDSAFERYQASLERTADSLPDLAKLKDLPMPEIQEVPDAETGREVLEATEAYVQRSMGIVQGLGLRQVLQTSVDTANAALALASATSQSMRSVLSLQLMPGWFARHPQVGDATTDSELQASLEHFEATLDSVEGTLSAVVPALDQRWDRVVIHAGAAMRNIARTSNLSGNPYWASVTKIWGRYSGVVTAIASERDPDEVARAIDEIAAPIGGWKRKGRASSMVTVSAHPGLFTGGEARWGSYGVIYEDGGTYPVTPVLTFPLGVEISTSTGGWVFGAFVPLLDPLAYLQYDPSNDGRLPGAQITTAIALGAGFRVGFPETPFSLIPMVVYRPAFRAWESQLAGSGANVLQFGVAASIDVTLWDLWVNP